MNSCSRLRTFWQALSSPKRLSSASRSVGRRSSTGPWPSCTPCPCSPLWGWQMAGGASWWTYFGSYLAATASHAQHYLVSTPLKLNTFFASNSTLFTLNNLVLNNNESNTTSIQHYFNSTTLHFNKFSLTISHSIPLLFNNLTFNNLTFNKLTFNNLILDTPYIQQPHFQQFYFQQSHFQQSHVHYVFFYFLFKDNCSVGQLGAV